MTTDRRADNAEISAAGQRVRRDHVERNPIDARTTIPLAGDAIEAILRQVVGLRAASVIDDQLAQLIRLVDSATWSAPVPMTVLVDGASFGACLFPAR